MKYFGIVMTVVVLALLVPIARVNTGASRVSVANNSTEVVTMATEAEVPTTSTLTEEPTTMTEAVTEVASESNGCSPTVDVAYDITHCDSTEAGTGYNYPTASYSNYSDDDRLLLAKLIYTEAGCEWIPNEVQLAVGSVVLNRVNSDLYPNSIRDVLYDPGQYEMWVFDNMYVDEGQFARAYSNADALLTYGSTLPSNVLGQNSTKEGDDTYDEYHDPELGTTIYFTYIYG